MPAIFSASEEHDRGGFQGLKRQLPSKYKRELSDQGIWQECRSRDMYGPMMRIKILLPVDLTLMSTRKKLNVGLVGYGFMGRPHSRTHWPLDTSK